MIKNKSILEELRERKERVSCENCKYCDLRSYHSGKYYCSKISVFDKVPIKECFESKNK